jgi:subtilisin family serine protease
MKHLLLMVCLLAGSATASAQVDYIPQDLLLHYEPLAARTAPDGATLIDEHAQVGAALRTAQALPAIERVSPLFPGLVGRMVREHATEADIHRAIHRERAERRGRPVSPAFDPAAYAFARYLHVRLAAPETRPVDALEQALAPVLAQAGYRLLGVERNDVHRGASVPNDPLYPWQYAHPLTGAPLAWDVERGAPDVVIGIMDTGIDPQHPDLVANLVPGYDFIDLPPGYMPAWRYIAGEDYMGLDDDPSDAAGHGTHVAGVAAAKGDDGYGVTGVCPDCGLMALRVGIYYNRSIDAVTGDTITDTGMFLQSQLQAMEYAVQHGVDILNMSYGGHTPSPPSFVDMANYCHAQGLFMVASAGNDTMAMVEYPAALEPIVGVAATDRFDHLAVFSNYGAAIDLSAPGDQILSTDVYHPALAHFSDGQVWYGSDSIDIAAAIYSGFTDLAGIEGPLAYIGLAREEDEQNPAYDWDLQGKIALVYRGEITFREKVLRAQEHGAIGVIIYNNQPVIDATIDLLEPLPEPIPVGFIEQADGQTLLAGLQNGALTTVRYRLIDYPRYALRNGTSMSAPYVAGAAGLLLSQNPALTPVELRQRLVETAVDIDALNPAYAGQLGAGRVNLGALFAASPVQTPSPSAEISLSIFPNPTVGTLSLDWTHTAIQSEAVEVTVYDQLGRRVLAQPVAAGTSQLGLDVAALRPGVYAVELRSGGQHRATRRFVKNNL